MASQNTLAPLFAALAGDSFGRSFGATLETSIDAELRLQEL